MEKEEEVDSLPGLVHKIVTTQKRKENRFDFEHSMPLFCLLMMAGRFVSLPTINNGDIAPGCLLSRGLCSLFCFRDKTTFLPISTI